MEGDHLDFIYDTGKSLKMAVYLQFV